jgi:hypothetical protein
MVSGAGENSDGNGGNDGLAEAIRLLAAALDRKAEAPDKPQGSTTWGAVKPIVESLLPSIVMFGLGYVFIQAVELDLKREAFTAEAADKLKSYVDTLITAGADERPEKLRATALALGGFGAVAAFPLVSIIDSGGERRIASAKLGLEQAGRVAPEATCAIIAGVIDDPTDAYGWETRKATTEVAGLVGCDEASTPLRDLKPVVGSKWTLTNEQRANFEGAIDQALERIEAAGRRK